MPYRSTAPQQPRRAHTQPPRAAGLGPGPASRHRARRAPKGAPREAQRAPRRQGKQSSRRAAGRTSRSPAAATASSPTAGARRWHTLTAPTTPAHPFTARAANAKKKPRYPQLGRMTGQASSHRDRFRHRLGLGPDSEGGAGPLAPASSSSYSRLPGRAYTAGPWRAARSLPGSAPPPPDGRPKARRREAVMAEDVWGWGWDGRQEALERALEAREEAAAAAAAAETYSPGKLQAYSLGEFMSS